MPCLAPLLALALSAWPSARSTSAQAPVANAFVAFRFDDQHVIAVVKDGELSDSNEKVSPSAKPAARYGFSYFDPGPARLAQVQQRSHPRHDGSCT